MKKLFLLFILLFGFRTNVAAQQVINGDSSYVPGAWQGSQLPNAASTGTTLFSIAKLTGAGTAVISATTDTSGMLGIVGSGAGITGNATIAQVGQVQCNFDGATTANDYVINSPTVAGDCSDAGSTPPTTQILGRVLSTNGGAGTYNISISIGGTSNTSGFLLTTANTWLQSQAFKGTDPWADITAYGAKAVGVTVFPSTTATCTGTTCTLGAAVFNNGDGITIRGAGNVWNGSATPATTPSAPTVTPSLAVVSTVQDAPSTAGVNSITGGTSYCYKVIARDQFGALTAPSTATCIANGLASLGLQTLTVSTLARSGSTVTVTTTGTQQLSIGTLVHIYGSTNAQFSGFFNVTTVNNGTNTFTITNTPMDTNYGAATSATGGSVGYFTSNALTWTAVSGAWKYYICASRPADSGAYHLIGSSAPTQQNGNQYTITSFFDFGATVNGNQTYPSYVTDSACTGSATKDPLTTTVASGGGTTSITLANAAVTSVTGATAVYDAAPSILAAVKSLTNVGGNFIGGSIYIPPAVYVGQTYGYPINSYLKIPSRISVIQSGPLIINETVELGTNTNWNGGMGVNPSAGSFAFGTWALEQCWTADPCFYSNASNNGIYQNMTINSGTPSTNNGGTLWLTDDAYNVSWQNVSMDTNQDTTTDYLGKALVLRSTNSGGNIYHFDHVSWGSGPAQTADASWSPLVYIPMGLNSSQVGQTTNEIFDAKTVFFTRRGLEWDTYGGGYNCKMDWAYRQGGISPFITLGTLNGAPGGFCSVSHLLLDTETEPIIANLDGTGGTLNSVFETVFQTKSASTEAGGIPPAIQGTKPYAVNYDQSHVTYTQGLGVETHDQSGMANSVVTATKNFNCPEISTPPAGIAGYDILYCDATAHAFKIINNNGTASPIATLADFSSPPAIGNTTPGSGVFTTLTATSLLDIKASPLSIEIANAVSTGTTVNLLAKLTGAPSTAVVATTTDTVGVVGCVVSGAGTTGNAVIATAGTTVCTFDGATTAGDYVIVSTSSNGKVHDAGSTEPTGVQTLGRVLSSNGGGGVYAMIVFPPDQEYTAGGGGGGGSVTSVGLTNSDTNLTITGSPITTSGTLTVNFPNYSNHFFLGNHTGGSAAPAPVQPTLADIAAGAAGSGTYDFSGITLGKWRLSAGLTTSANGDFGYDTTNKNWHIWENAGDKILGIFGSTPAGSKCLQSTVSASVITITEAATGCGSGGTVTSVALTAPTGFTVSGSPITSSGTITLAMPSGWILGDLLGGSGSNTVARVVGNISSTAAILTSTGSGGVAQAAVFTPTVGGGTNPSMVTLTSPSAADTLCESGGLVLVNCPNGVVVNTQSGTSYTVQSTDRGATISFTSASAKAVTLPQAGSAGFASSFVFGFSISGGGAATITPTTSTITARGSSGLTSLVILSGQSGVCYSDNTNYVCSVSGFGTGTTGSITGTALTATCDSGTVTINGAVAGQPVEVSSTTGADVGGAFYLRGSVTSSNTVTVYVCGTGTPSSLAYNVRILP